MVALAGKTGFLYVFDRVTGAPIWPIEERPVPKSDMPGEQSWPTQPFPTNPPPFSKQSFSVDDINPHPIITDAQRETFKQRFAATRNQGLFTPIHFDDTLHIPGSNGGALFGYTAAEPSNGAVYVISQDNPAILHLVKNPQAAAGPPGLAVYRRECAVCHGLDRSGTQNGPSLLDVPGSPRRGNRAVHGHDRQGTHAGLPSHRRRRARDARDLSRDAGVRRSRRPRPRRRQSIVPTGAGGRLRRSAGARGPRRWTRPRRPTAVPGRCRTDAAVRDQRLRHDWRHDEAAVHQAIALRPQHRARSSGRWASETTPGWRRAASPALV